MTPTHFEVEAVVGARVRDLTRVLKNRFESKTDPMDVVLCAGINNVGDGQAEGDILKEFADFQQVIYEHSEKNNHIVDGLDRSTLSIIPILIPPKYASFLDTKNIPPNFVNKLSTIESLNTSIVALNRVYGESTVTFLNTYGIRNKRGKKRSHRLSSFVESEISRKLHLTYKLKAEAALQIGKYFADK